MAIRTVVTRGYGAGATIGLVVTRGYSASTVTPPDGIIAGFFSIANCVKDLDFRNEMYDQAQSTSVWAFWLLGVDLPTDPIPKLSANLKLNIALIQNEAEGNATWARWAPGTQPENTGSLQLDMVAALNANFVLT